MEDLMAGVGRALKKRREELDVSAAAIAEGADVARQTVRKIERHTGSANPNLSTILRMCIALQIEPADVLPDLDELNSSGSAEPA